MTNFYSYADHLHEGFLSAENQIDGIISILERTTGIVYTCGNGGSAANASHFTQDLLKRCGIRSVCLSDNIYHALAIANDIAFEEIYSWYIRTMYRPDDVLFLISGSGYSENLVRAAITMDGKIDTIALVGSNGGNLKKICDFSLHTPISNMGLTESVHSAILHFIVERLAYGNKSI